MWLRFAVSIPSAAPNWHLPRPVIPTSVLSANQRNPLKVTEKPTLDGALLPAATADGETVLARPGNPAAGGQAQHTSPAPPLQATQPENEETV